jgi:hypothetical protein
MASATSAMMILRIGCASILKKFIDRRFGGGGRVILRSGHPPQINGVDVLGTSLGCSFHRHVPFWLSAME